MPNSDSRVILAGAAVAAAVALTSTVINLTTITSTSRKIIPSPRTTLLPHLTQAQKDSLGYPPDALPGARDVDTPHGSMRVYEWGPVDGRRVLMIHGDATPAPLFKHIADQLVDRGCRVMTFDTWGRGYTDAPVDAQHNSQLFMQQIMFAIISSPVQWTGSIRFSIVGFSLGGAITLDFFGHNPTLVESLVLLGPAGMLRKLPGEYKSFFFHHPALASAAKMRSLLGTALGVDLQYSKSVQVSDKPEGFTPAGACQFQFDHHAGHLESFLSTIQNGPIEDQTETYGKAGRIITGSLKKDTPLCGGTILVICGQDDTVIPPTDTKEDLKKFFGDEILGHWIFETVPGGHGFPWPQGAFIGKRIAEFWGLM